MIERVTPLQIEQAKRSGDLASIVGKRVPLKKKGRDWWGCCPFHADRDPSFKVDPKGFYKCFGCGEGGDAITWLQKFEGMTFQQAVRALLDDFVPAGVPLTRPAYAPKPVEETDEYIIAKKIWDASLPAKGTPAETYLRETRRIRLPLTEDVRFHPRLKFTPTKQFFPAVVLRLTDDEGFRAIQRIFLQHDRPEKIAIPDPHRPGKLLRAKMTLGPMLGAAVRTRMPAGDVLGISEGYETAQSAAQLYSLTVWATCGTGRFSKMQFGEAKVRGIQIPQYIRRIIIFGDPGKSGCDAAFGAQDYYEHLGGFESEVIFPAAHYECGEDDDYNNILVNRASRRLATHHGASGLVRPLCKQELVKRPLMVRSLGEKGT